MEPATATNEPERDAVFEVRIWVRVPLEVFSHCDTLTPEANALTQEAKRDIEQAVIQCLRRLEYTSDVELVGVALEDA